MTSSSHVMPPFELQEEQYFSFLTSSTSSLICTSPSNFNPSQEHKGSYHREILKQYQEAQEVDEYGSHGGSTDQQNLSPPSLSTLESGSEYGIKHERGDQPKVDKGAPVSWMSSKMRLMKKMIHSERSLDGDKSIGAKLWFRDQKQSSLTFDTRTTNDNLASNSTIIRTCSDCNTTRTPLWRGGPQGPKSLCNACGIRQRKARRALAAATASANNGVHATNTSSLQTKVQCFKKKSGKGHVGRQKKQCKPSATPCRQTNNLGFEDFIVNLSNNLVLHRVIPQDETEAAILLMALSCGLVSG